MTAEDCKSIRAPFYSNGETYEGRAFVYQGSAAGLSTAPAWTTESDQAYAYLGFGPSVGTAGDVNRDGYDELIVGVRYYDHGEGDEGVAVVIRGHPTGVMP